MAFKQQLFGIWCTDRTARGVLGTEGLEYPRYPTPSPSLHSITPAPLNEAGQCRAWQITEAAKKDMTDLMRGFGDKLSKK